MINGPTRRDVLSTIPAAAWLGTGLAGLAFGQAAEYGPDPAPEPQHVQAPGRGSLIEKMLAESYQGNQYALPALPYPVEALEPFIDAKTVQVHHDVHHLNYVKGLNRAVRQLQEMTLGGAGELDNNQLVAIQRDLSFNAGGHFLHTAYWATMGSGQVEPVGEIAATLSRQFGSIDSFRRYFTKVAATIKGSGWAVLAYEPVADYLLAYAVHDHDSYLAPGSQPLLPLDVWEHAYYFKYGPARAEYVQAWWNVVNWNVVNEAYLRVRTLRQREAIMTSGR